jgi:hypothetical protein
LFEKKKYFDEIQEQFEILLARISEELREVGEVGFEDQVGLVLRPTLLSKLKNNNV